MKRNVYRFLVFVCISLLVSCSALHDKSAINKTTQKPHKISDENHTKKMLYSHFDEWRGVRYQIGGLGRNGIDCSGFVYLTYKSKFGLHLPRTTRLQSKLGKEIHKSELTAGDLIFFRTGPNSKHVGIYIEKNKFLHASQKKGIIISRLDNVYWKANYWKSVRI